MCFIGESGALWQIWLNMCNSGTILRRKMKLLLTDSLTLTKSTRICFVGKSGALWQIWRNIVTQKVFDVEK